MAKSHQPKADLLSAVKKIKYFDNLQYEKLPSAPLPALHAQH